MATGVVAVARAVDETRTDAVQATRVGIGRLALSPSRT